MAGGIARALRQSRPFRSKEQEVVLGVRLVAARVVEVWEAFLRREADLGTNQYNILRILRGSHPERVPSGDIGVRMVHRDPDVTRHLDRLVRRGLVSRARSRRDRRVVEVGITDAGLALLKQLDPHAERYPVAMVGHLGPKKLDQLARLLEDVIKQPKVFP